MTFSPSIRQSSPFLGQRIKYFLSRLFGTRLQKDKSIHFVTVNGTRFKRVILCDSFLAKDLCDHLERFNPSGFFPDVVARYEREVWLEYVDGKRVRSVDEQFVQNIAEFYATVYGESPILRETDESKYVERLFQDLRFLRRIGVLSEDVYRDLCAAVPELAPKHVWVGYDYTDPVLKNFLLRSDNGRLCTIDVDGLASGQLIGMGVAKACVRWMDSHRSLFFSSMIQYGGPNIQEYFPFVELCFLAKWTKRAFFEHDWKVIDHALFERFRRLE